MSRTITLTIDENGDQLFLKSDGAEMFRALGITVTRRASHVEPDNAALRLVFRVVRFLVSDASAVAQWTRGWRCLWRVHVIAQGADILLSGRYTDRKQAIESEIQFLNKFFTGEHNESAN